MIILRRRDAADDLGVSERTLDRLVGDGLIPWVDLGRGRIRHRKGFDKADIDQFKLARKRRETGHDK
ncbi:hypothetical protein JQ625_27310 [Bradyrhizobium diazoefficiens]|nr:hypothetical protein [Bradyrhizobium diazoefficiens]MBR0778558.1 hypothetical protein [Bradyrhizobium diazoefficiens]